MVCIFMRALECEVVMPLRRHACMHVGERAGERAGGRKHTGTRTYVYGYEYTRTHAHEYLGFGVKI
jgi:hypothetical protein